MGKGIYYLSLLAVLVSYVLGCSKLEPGARATGKEDDEYETDDRKVYYSQVVVFGEVSGNVTGDYPFSDIPGVYTVKFNVICTYKGGPVPSTIYIAGMGNVKGELPHCPSVPMKSKTNIIMFLKRTSKPEVFEIEFRPTVGDTGVILDDLSIVCGLTLEEDSDELCSDFEPLEEDCMQWTPKIVEVTTIPPIPEPRKTTPMVKKPVSTSKVIDIGVKPEPEDNNQSDQAYETKTEKNPGKSGQVSGNNRGGGPAVVASTLLMSLTTVLLAVLV